jgi:hypothetical protein
MWGQPLKCLASFGKRIKTLFSFSPRRAVDHQADRIQLWDALAALGSSTVDGS